MGWAYVWYNHSQAKTLCSKLIDYFAAQTKNNPGATGQMYNLDGTINKEANGSETCIPTFLGPFTVGGMVDAKYQTWVNNGYKRLLSFNAKNDKYYNECLELLTMLLLTGNMPDFTKEQPRTTATLTVKTFPEGAGNITINPQKSTYNVGEQVTVSTSPKSSRYIFVGWDGDIQETSTSVTFKINYNMVITAVYKDEEAEDLVDDCEDGDGLTYLGSEWFSYTDVLDSGKSTVTPLSKKGVDPFKMTEGGYKSSKYAAKISWKLDKGKFEYDPFVGMGFELAPDAAYVDISSSTGIRFVYKGNFGKSDTCDIKIECGDVTQPGADYSYNLEPSSDWKEITVTWDKFLQPWWVTKKDQVPLNLKKINKIQWQIHGQTGASGELWIDDVHLIGYSIPRVKQKRELLLSEVKTNSNFLSKISGNKIFIKFPLKQQGKIKTFIYDLAGRTVLKNETYLEDNDNLTLTIDKSKWQHNCFIIKANTQEGSFTQKIIMEK